MRVAILNQYALPLRSPGITRHADLAAELARRGHHVTIVASDFDYLMRRRAQRRRHKEVASESVEFVWLRTGSYTGNDRRRVRSILRYTIAAGRAAMRLHPAPDVIIGSSPHPLVALSASLAATRLRVPWIFEARDIWPSALVDLGALRRGGATHRILELVERFAYATSARVVMVPPRGGMRVTELGIREEKVAYIPNAVDLSTPPGALPAGLEAILRDLHGKFVVAYTGALGVPNDLESALEGMACLQDGDGTLPQDVALLLIGGGVHLDALKKRAKDLKVANVFFHDPIEKTAVRTVLARSDAGLMQAAASDHFKYGFSANKLFDYFAAGKPVLISSVYPTIVEEAGAGVRFDPGDPAAWANAVANLTRMPPAERGAMGERGRELVRSRYSIRAITDTYERLLHEVIDSRD